MDMKLQSSVTKPDSFQTWDYEVIDGIVPILDDSGNINSQEDSQGATISAFLQRGTVPQNPDLGVEWVEYFTGQRNFGVIDGQIKSALISNGLTTFYPTYDLVNGNLTVKVVSQ